MMKSNEKISPRKLSNKLLLVGLMFCMTLFSLSLVSSVEGLASPYNLTSSNSLDPYRVTQSRAFSSEFYAGWRSFSQLSDNQNFGSGSCVGDWINLDFGSGNTKNITIAGIRTHSSDTTRVPTAYKFQGSNNNATWTDLGSDTISNTANALYNTSLISTTEYRYYRIYITTSSSGGYCGINRIWLYEPIQGQSISLDSPENNYFTSNESETFSSTFTISVGDYNWTNATLYIWNENGTIFNINTTNITGTSNITNITAYNLVVGNYYWNYLGYYGNITNNYSVWSESNYTFQWRPFTVESQTFDPFVYETSSQRFDLQIETLEDILSVNSKLIYNGSQYSATTSCSSGNCSIYSIIDIPLVPSGEMENFTYYWNITVFDGTNSYSFSTLSESNQQNVTRLHLEECDGTYTVKALNFTAYTESNLTRIDPFSIDGTFNIWTGGGSVTRNNSFSKLSTDSLALCLTPTDETQQVDAQIDYYYSDENVTYNTRNYYLDNATISSSTNNISLYLLDSTLATSFIIKVQDQKLSPVEDSYVYIQRYYPSIGQFKTVQVSKTDSNGETVGFYKTETVDYKHIIIKDGSTLLETSQQRVVGKTVPYTLTFTVGDLLNYPWSNFLTNSSLLSNLTYNDTSQIVTFTYIDTTGMTTTGRLIVVEENNNNRTIQTICDVSSSESSSTLTCNMSGYEGYFIAYGYNELDVIDLINFVINGAREIFDREGLLLGIFIIMVAGFAFIWNPTASIIAINISTIFVNILGLVALSPIYIFGMIAISLIAIALLKT